MSAGGRASFTGCRGDVCDHVSAPAASGTHGMYRSPTPSARSHCFDDEGWVEVPRRTSSIRPPCMSRNPPTKPSGYQHPVIKTHRPASCSGAQKHVGCIQARKAVDVWNRWEAACGTQRRRAPHLYVVMACKVGARRPGRPDAGDSSQRRSDRH